MENTRIIEIENNFNYLNKIITKKKEYEIKRNFGIDLLRIFSMINIIILHINLISGKLNLNSNNKRYRIVWRLETLCYCSVNNFGLISGIVGYKKYKFSNLIFIWILSSFHSFTFSFYLYTINKIDLKELILSLFPLLKFRNWYVNAYFSMYLFLPFINFGIMNLDRKTYKRIIIFFFLFYSIYHIISISLIGNSQYHFLNGGYSTLWLIILYISGGYYGKYFLNIKKELNFKIYIILIFIYLCSSFLSSELFFALNNQILIDYISPTIVLQALSLVILFSQLNIKNKLIIKIISFFNPLTFSVTIIHLRPMSINTIFQKNLFNYINKLNDNLLFFKIYGIGIILFIFFAFIDYLRLLLFKLLRVKKICLFIEDKFPLIIDKINI